MAALRQKRLPTLSIRPQKHKKTPKNTFLPLTSKPDATGTWPLPSDLFTLCLFTSAEVDSPELLKFRDIVMGRFTPARRLAPPYPRCILGPDQFACQLH